MTTIQIYYKGAWTTVVTFGPSVKDYVIIDTAMAIDADPTIPHENVAVVDGFDGEVMWDAAHAGILDDYALECMEHMNDCEPADIDSDMGFDPYMGCFSDDC